MTDPHEIIEEALANAHDIDMTDALYAKAIVRKLEAAGFRLLSADGVTDEMGDAARYALPGLGVFSHETREAVSAAILAAPLFGKGREA